MRKKILPIFLLVALCLVSFFSCRKDTLSTADATRGYFPLTLGKSVTYAVDSTLYYGPPGTTRHVSMLFRYTISDTVTYNKKTAYLMDIYSTPYVGGIWTACGEIIITPTPTSLLYAENNVNYIKMIFPIANGTTWKGNQYAVTPDSLYSYLYNWDYTYANFGLSYFNGRVNFDHTVSLLEDDENVDYQNVDSAVAGYRTYAKEVYAYGVGMIYKEWTHYTFGPPDTVQNKNGYSVTMRAIDYN